MNIGEGRGGEGVRAEIVEEERVGEGKKNMDR